MNIATDIKQIEVEIQSIIDHPIQILMNRVQRKPYSEADVIVAVDVVRKRMQNILHTYFPKEDA